MKRKWKKCTALCLAVLLTGFVPMETMQAAEQSAKLQVQDVSDSVCDTVPEEVQTTQDTEDTSSEDIDGTQEAIDETVSGEMPGVDGAISEEIAGAIEDLSETDETSCEEQESVQDAGLDVNSGEEIVQIKSEIETMQAQQLDSGSAANDLAPVIDVRLPGNVQTHPIGGRIEYTYIGNHDQRIYISVEQGIALYYYFESLSEMPEESRDEEQLNSLWQGGSQNGYQEIALNKDGRFILYLRADGGNGQTISLRTDGIVVDATAPVIVGINNGGSYPEGTTFRVNDDNLDTVKINEQVVEPSAADGAYQLVTDNTSTSCVIRVTDKAGNETVYSVTVEKKNSDQDPDKDPDQNPGDEISIIDMNGTYSLRAGKAYQLGGGRWTVGGDSTVYRGGSTFYVSADGDYSFQRK